MLNLSSSAKHHLLTSRLYFRQTLSLVLVIPYTIGLHCTGVVAPLPVLEQSVIKRRVGDDTRAQDFNRGPLQAELVFVSRVT